MKKKKSLILYTQRKTWNWDVEPDYYYMIDSDACKLTYILIYKEFIYYVNCIYMFLILKIIGKIIKET